MATNPEYRGLFEQAREIILDDAEAIGADLNKAFVHIPLFTQQLDRNPLCTITPEDSPEIQIEKIKLRASLIAQQQALNKDAIDFAKFTLKMRGSYRGWRERQEVEHTADSTLSELLLSMNKPQKTAIELHKNESKSSDDIDVFEIPSKD